MPYNGILWETTHQGKLQGLSSISTACAMNKHCVQRMQDKEGVCSHCYALTYMKMRPTLRHHLCENTTILTEKILTQRELPVTNSLYYRLESFGDIANETQLINYFNICNYNPDTKFALWTKNIWIVDSVLCNINKPENLSIVLSSVKINKEVENVPSYVDHVFTVYDKSYIKENNVAVNCGEKTCLECKLCYNKNTEFSIKEQLK